VEVVVGIADMRVSDDSDVVLAAYSLGSCIGVAVWDPAVRVGGLLSFMLPDSKVAPEKAQQNPCMFADTGIPLLLDACEEKGAERKRMVVKLAGGTQPLDSEAFLDVGRRNLAVALEILEENGLSVDAKDVGGMLNLTLKLEVGTGKVWVVAANREVRAL